MTLLTRLLGVRSAVEVGTFTGYGALCIARGLAPGGRLLCCDVSEEWTAIGRAAWERGRRRRSHRPAPRAGHRDPAVAPGRAHDRPRLRRRRQADVRALRRRSCWRACGRAACCWWTTCSGAERSWIPRSRDDSTEHDPCLQRRPGRRRSRRGRDAAAGRRPDAGPPACSERPSELPGAPVAVVRRVLRADLGGHADDRAERTGAPHDLGRALDQCRDVQRVLSASCRRRTGRGWP